MFCKASGAKYSVMVARLWRDEKGNIRVSNRFSAWMRSVKEPIQARVGQVFVQIFTGGSYLTLFESTEGAFCLTQTSHRVLDLDRVDRITVAFVSPFGVESPDGIGVGISYYTPCQDHFQRGFGSSLAVARALIALGDIDGAQEVAESAKIPWSVCQPKDGSFTSTLLTL